MTPDAPEPEPTDERAQPGSAADALTVYVESHEVQRSPAVFARLARSAVGLARSASPRLFAVVVGIGAGNAALLALQVVLGKLAIDQILHADDQGRAVTHALPALIGLVAATAVSGLLTSVQGQLQRLLGERVQQMMWGRILDVTTSVPMEAFEDPRFFDDLQRVRTNALVRPVTLSQGLTQVWAGVLALAVLGVTLVVISPVLLVVLAVGGVPLWLISRRTGRLEFAFTVAQTPPVRLRSYLTDTLSGRDEAKEVRAFGLEAVLRDRWARSYDRYLADHLRLITRLIAFSAVGAFATLVVTSVALAILLYAVHRGSIALGSAGAAIIAIRLVAGRIQSVFSGLGVMFESSLFLQDFHAFTARQVVGDDDVGRPAPPFAELRVEGVSFRYPGAAHEALKDVSLSVRAGETIALVGENGSGKTTLAKIIARLYTPTSGQVMWNGADAASLSTRSVRERVGVLFQDYLRFQLLARENIGFGRVDAIDDEARIVEAARRAGAAEVIERLPQGYDTGLGREFLGGVDLSGGQWQRVAIARGFFRDAELLVLDEPTAALDARAEARVFEQVRDLASGKSLMLVSHRFSTVKDVDRIYVLHDGELVEQGTHDELVALGGRYAELFELQARSYR